MLDLSSYCTIKKDGSVFSATLNTKENYRIAGGKKHTRVRQTGRQKKGGG